jgi:hypothetical protein
MGKAAFRERMLAASARDHRVPIAYVNQVGGDDALLFDGGSILVGADGAVLARGPLVGALQGSDNGLATNGIGGTITRAGFQAHDGYIYETLTGRGGILVGIRHEPRAADALAKLHAYGGGNAAIGAWTGRL